MSNSELTSYFIEQHPRETASILSSYSPEKVQEFLNPLPDNLLVNLVRYLTPDLTVSCLGQMPAKRAAAVLENLGVDSAARLISRMQSGERNSILAAMSTVMSNRLIRVLRYPVGTIGRYLSPDIFVAKEDMLVGELITAVKNTSSEVLDDIFIVDDEDTLVGVVDMKNLVIADPEDSLLQIMKIPDTVLNSRSFLDYVKNNPRWRFTETLPVVDQKQAFVGVLKRSTMDYILEGEQAYQETNADLMESVIDAADLLWEVCFNFIQTGDESSSKGKKP